MLEIGIGKVSCEECGVSFRAITDSHVRKHGMTFAEYREKYSDSEVFSERLKQQYTHLQFRAKYPIPSKQELHQLYWEEKLTLKEIAKLKNVCGETVKKWMHKRSVKRRDCSERQKGPSNSCWRGGRITMDGYVKRYVPNHPSVIGKRRPYVLEHVLVWEKTHGMPVPKGHIIHHINGIRELEEMVWALSFGFISQRSMEV